MSIFDNEVYDRQARSDILAIRRQFPDKVFALQSYELPSAKGFYKLNVAVLGSSQVYRDPSDMMFSSMRDASTWTRKIHGILGMDQATANAIIEDVARRAALDCDADEPTAEVRLTKGEIQTLIESGVDVGYNPNNPEDNDAELESSMQKLDAALLELSGGPRIAR